jgi:hypothetical protein
LPGLEYARHLKRAMLVCFVVYCSLLKHCCRVSRKARFHRGHSQKPEGTHISRDIAEMQQILAEDDTPQWWVPRARAGCASTVLGKGLSIRLKHFFATTIKRRLETACLRADFLAQRTATAIVMPRRRRITDPPTRFNQVWAVIMHSGLLTA